jgi:hypothetical protein
MSESHLLAACTIGSAVLLLASDCQAQGNIDRGKTPAQAFAETCAACHRGPRALKRISAAFLSQHYSVSSAEASAMATYVTWLVSQVSRLTNLSVPRPADLRRGQKQRSSKLSSSRRGYPKDFRPPRRSLAANVQPMSAR